MKKFRPQPGFVVQAFRFALDPNAAQEPALRSHCGAARAAYNWAVGWVTASWWQRKAEESYGIPEAELTRVACRGRCPRCARRSTRPSTLIRRFAAWWEENSKEAYSTGLANAAAAFDNYAKSKNGKRQGQADGDARGSSRSGRRACPAGSPPARSASRPDGRHVTLPRLGHDPRPRAHRASSWRRVQAGTARILSATVRHERGRWFVVLPGRGRAGDRAASPAREVAVGIDLGVKTLAVMADSTGEIREVPNPWHLDSALKAPAPGLPHRVSRRQGPDRRTGSRPSKRWEKANARAGNKVHHRVANLRADALHKLTTADDGRVRHGRGRRPQRRRDAPQPAPGPADRRCRVRRDPPPAHLQDPAANGCRIVVADRWFPSSKTCSGCGAVKAKLPLHVRTYACDACGLVIDRDDNAARNLAALAAARSHWYRSGRRPGHRQGVEASWSRPEDPHHPPRPQGRGGAGRWRNPAAPAADGNGRPYSSRSPHALVM